MTSNKNRLEKVLFAFGLSVFAVYAHSGTICYGLCIQVVPMLVEDNQYKYSGYLSDLTVSSSQQLPVSLMQFYNMLGVNAGAAVPMSISLTVERASSQYQTSFGYSYLAVFGNVSLSGAINFPITTSAGYYAPFSDNINTYPAGVVDQVNIGTSSYFFNSTDPLLAIQSRNFDTPGSINIIGSGRDGFRLLLNDSTASAINNNFPDTNSTLEALFQSGNFLLAGSIQIKDANGIITPFNGANMLYLNGTLSSEPVSLNPSQTDIGSTCNYGVAVCFTSNPSVIVSPSGGTLTPVPSPSAALLFLSSLVGLINVRVGNKKRDIFL